MDEKKRQTNWTIVVRRGKTQTKAKEKAPVKPQPKTSTTAGKRRVPLQPKCASTPKSKNKQQPKPQPKQRSKPPPTVPADVPSSEQWDFLWPSPSTLPQAPLRRTKTVKAPLHNSAEKHMTKISVRGVSDFTDAGDSLPTEASDGENAAPKQQKPKTKTCSFRWGLKQQPEDQRSESPAASEQVPEQTQSQQHLQPFQTWSPLQLMQPLEEDPLDFLSTRRSPTNTTAERLESAELYSVFQYPLNGTNAGELVQAMHFVLDVLERRRRLDDFMESTDIFGSIIPYINSNSDSDRDSHFRTDASADNKKRPRVGEPEKGDDQKENDRGESVCRESVPRFRSERDEYTAYLVKLLNAFRLVENETRIISGHMHHHVKAVEFLLMVAVAEKSDGRLPLPATLHDLPPQHLCHMRRLMEMEKLPAEYYLRKAANFCRGIHGFIQEPHENYTHGANCSSTAGKEVQTSEQLPVLPPSSPEAHSPQTRFREILLHRTVRLVHDGDTVEDQQNQLTPTGACVANNAQCTKSLCHQNLKTMHAEYQLLNPTPSEGGAATPIQTSLQQPKQYTRIPTYDQRRVIRPPPPPDSTSWHAQPPWQYNPFPFRPMTILPTPQPNKVQSCNQNKEKECGWSGASPLPSQWQLANRENCQYSPMRGEANVSISHMRPSANFTKNPPPPHSGACRSEWQTNSMFKRVTNKPAYVAPECQPLPSTFGSGNYHPQEQPQDEWSDVPTPKEVDWSFEFTGDYLDRDMIVLPQESKEQRPPNTHAQGACFLPTAAGTNMEAEQRHPLFWPHQQLVWCNPIADNRRDWIACKGFFSVSTSSSDTQSCDSCELQEVESSQLEGYRQAPSPHPSHYTSTSGLVVQDSAQSHQRLEKRRRGKKQLQQLPQQHIQQQEQHQRLLQQHRQQQPKPHALPVQLHDIQVTEILPDINFSYCVPLTFSKDPQNTKNTGEKGTLTLSKPSEVETNCSHPNSTRTAATAEHVSCSGATEIFTAKGSRKKMGTLRTCALNTSRKSSRNSSVIHRECIGRVNGKRSGRDYSVCRFELSVA
ncbi:hypothetical protein EMWEY_00050480 [Eimeria maxima]|uniref:Uncharacterized protein n=1 Tax=Eimeria maxima TaxID=5804 RepID=U6M316_EIMMA|nr:hypothetical protein EMWEY_00050480 [Eimeria maxima]CDJ58421.1 hypothetical protein EMWEY_00050480 [Eimeria maxima]